jgi:ParB-like chromosome segregation protein Spo0J
VDEKVTRLIKKIVIAKGDCPPPSGQYPPSGEAFNRLKKDISDHGLLSPVFITVSGVCVSGHYRLWACESLGHKEVWAVVVRNLDEAVSWFEQKKVA